MVDRAEFFRVADEIRAEGRQPSQRAIRERLANGGSFSELGPLYAEWTMARDYHPRPTTKDLPKHLREKFEAFALDIWSAGQRSASETLQEKAREAIAERDALRVALAEASARADALEPAMPARAPAPVADREEPIREPVPAAPAEGDDPRAYWNRFLHRVADQMGDRTLRADAIFAELPPDVAAEAARRDGAWRPGRLVQKMRQKIKRGQLFLEPEEGFFCRRPEAA
jgi:hypothetical protein